jgi:sarcosine oxidase subunit beta
MTDLAQAEATVIGGGIFGLSAAYFLAKDGVEVVLVERDRIGGGASNNNAGEIYPRLSSPYLESSGSSEDQIMKESYEIYKHWNDTRELRYDIELDEDISVLTCMRDVDVRKMAPGQFDENLEKSGLSLLKRSEWQIPEPNLADDFTWGIETCVTRINIFRLCQGLRWAAERYGADILTDAAVTDIEVSDGKVQRVVTDKGTISSEFVVNAAGAWAPIIGRMVGIDIPIAAAIGEGLVTEPTQPLTNHLRVKYLPSWFSSDKPFIPYSKDPRKRLGITSEIDYHPGEANYVIARCEHLVELDETKTKVDTEPETLKFIAEGAIELIPQISRLNVIRVYAGLRPICDVDGKPILGKVEEIDGFVMAGGGWHTGMSLGPASGKLVSELIREGETSIQIDEFSLSRFQKTYHFPYVHGFRRK